MQERSTTERLERSGDSDLARADVGDVLGGLRRPQASSIGKRRENFASAFFPDLALVPAQRSEVFAPCGPLHGIRQHVQER